MIKELFAFLQLNIQDSAGVTNVVTSLCCACCVTLSVVSVSLYQILCTMSLSSKVDLAAIVCPDNDTDGSWTGWAISAKVLPSGYVGAVVTTLHAEFQVEWANPMWEAFGVDPHREPERIAASIRCVISTLEAPPPAALEISDASLGTSAMPVLQRTSPTKSFDWSSVLLAVAIVLASWWHRPVSPPPIVS